MRSPDRAAKLGRGPPLGAPATGGGRERGDNLSQPRPHRRADRHHRLRLDRPGHAAADRAALHLRPAPGARHRAAPTTHRTFLEQRGVHFIHHARHPRELPRAARPSSSPTAAGSASTSRSTRARSSSCASAASSASSTSTPWSSPGPGHYFDLSLDPADRTNYALREAVRAEKRANPGGPTAVSCCGANPGMVSWLLKEALLRLAADLGQPAEAPRDRAGWARLMQSLGVKGVHIAERDTQAGRDAKPIGSLRQHLVGRGLRLRELPAGRARLGHPRALVPAERPPAGARAARRRSTSTRRGSSPRSTPGRRRRGRSTAISSPTTRRSRSPTTSPSARATRRSSARPATMPITPATRRS